MEIKALVKQVNEVDYTVDILASSPAVDRDKEVILTTAWDMTNFLKNPVLVNSHDYKNVENILGKFEKIWIDNDGLHGTARYFVGQGNPKADWAWALAKNGIAAYSVGFIEKKSEPGTNGIAKIYTSVELLEISQVVVPANPEAIISSNDFKDEAYQRAYKTFKEVMTMEAKGVIPYHDYGNADENTEWDANAEVREADVEKLKKMCAWYDSNNPDVKSSYKLPHHRASDLKAVWRGVAAATAAVLGARGGVNMPDSDKEEAYGHLAKHYKDFGKEPPDFHKQYENEEEILKACGFEVETKYGRIISEANRNKIKDVLSAIEELEQKLKNIKTPLKELLEISEVEQNSVPLDTDAKLKEIKDVLLKIKNKLEVY
ncbi:MAG: hypothetical protein GX452_13960 [Ignavibacteriales bacterium]|nr:hypothetical protein [Ignavibacteriales bacterium]